MLASHISSWIRPVSPKLHGTSILAIRHLDTPYTPRSWRHTPSAHRSTWHRAGLKKKIRSQKQNESVKQIFRQRDREDSVRPIDVPLAKRPLQPPPWQTICGYCLKPRHLQRNCWMANRLYLVCGFGKYLMGNYPFRERRNDTPVRPALLVPPMLRDTKPTGRGTPFSPQQEAYRQSKKE